MARKSTDLRYIVTGPGLDPSPSYADPGPALSRSLTAALATEADSTFYVRDAITDEVLGYSERHEKLVFCHRN